MLGQTQMTHANTSRLAGGDRDTRSSESADCAPLFDKVALIGVGPIGSSLAQRMRAAGLARHIAIATRRAATRDRARALGLGDSYCQDPAEAVHGADLVILCVPVGAYGAIGRAIAPHLTPGTIVSDVGSVKQVVLDQLQQVLPEDVFLIPAHPLAGTENSGPDAGFAELFVNRWCIFTPPPGTPAEPLARLRAFWMRCGANIDLMTPQQHDATMALVSHLPHLIAYNIVGTVDDLETEGTAPIIKYAASGFRDFTRLAASDPTMWRDICLSNRDAILEMLGRFSEDLASLQRLIRWGEGDELARLFTRTRSVRRSIVEAGQEVDLPDFGRPPTRPEPSADDPRDAAEDYRCKAVS